MGRAMVTTGLVVASLLVGAGVAAAETLMPEAGSIVPVTGPSVGSGSPDSPTPELIPAVVAADTKAGHSAKAGATRLTPRSHSTPAAAKVAHKTGSKSTVKKTSAVATKRLAKSEAAAKAKHAAATKPKASAHHALVGKAVPVTKHSTTAPAGKGGAPAEPVLPRV